SNIVKSDGSVGIGTTTPGQKLTVVGTIESTSGGFKFPDGTTMTSAGTGAATSLTNNADAIVTGDSDANGTGNVIFQTGTNDRMTILNGGNVGIGTSTPGQKLDVNGNVNATKYFGDGSSLAGIADGTKLPLAGGTMTGAINFNGPTSDITSSSNQSISLM